MKLKMFLCVLFAACMIPTLSACNIFTIDTAELLAPPELTGDMAPIAKQLKASVKGNYTLKYPSSGDNRSSVIQKDVNGDGNPEIFVFYSTQEGDTQTMHLNLFCGEGEDWKSVSDQKIVAGGVDKVDFYDLDNDGILEILVGWEVYGTSEKQLSVYSLMDDSLSQRMMQRYTYFMCCDMNEDNKTEIFVINFSPAEKKNDASLFSLTDEGLTEMRCSLDKTVKSVSEPILSILSSGKRAIYVDETKGAGAITEVLFLEKNQLVNPLFNAETNETIQTLRSATIPMQDINKDSIVEIPVQMQVPSVTVSDVSEKLYLTKWCSFNGETLTVQLTTLMNYNDDYYLVIPQKWLGKMAVLKDTESSIREIYTYDQETTAIGEKLLYIQTVNKADWDSGKYGGLGLKKITENDDKVYTCWISENAAKEGITYNEISANFNIMG